jgi:hypothetical protein
VSTEAIAGTTAWPERVDAPVEGGRYRRLCFGIADVLVPAPD